MYVDSAFILHKQDEQLDFLLNQLSKIHPKLKFGGEEESSGRIIFLNLTFFYRSNEGFQTIVYRKAIIGLQFIQSFHTKQITHNVWFNFFQRAHNLCTNPQDIEKEPSNSTYCPKQWLS